MIKVVILCALFSYVHAGGKAAVAPAYAFGADPAINGVVPVRGGRLAARGVLPANVGYAPAGLGARGVFPADVGYGPAGLGARGVLPADVGYGPAGLGARGVFPAGAGYAAAGYPGAFGLGYNDGPFARAAPVAAVAPIAPLAAVGPVAAVGPAVVGVAPLDTYAHPHYNFGYSVSDGLTGDQKTQTEYRNGDFVKGQYSLVEPDGNIRTVHYTADAINGFNANVVNTGATIHRGAFAAPAVAVAPVALATAPIVAQVPVAAKIAVAPAVAVKAGPVVKAL